MVTFMQALGREQMSCCARTANHDSTGRLLTATRSDIMTDVKEHVAAGSPSDSAQVDNAMRVVEGRFFDCPDGLVMSADCLGQSYPTVIGGQPLMITVPRLPADLSSSLPALESPEYHYEYPRPDNAGEPAHWGEVTAARGGTPLSALIASLYYRFTTIGSDDDVSSVCEGIDNDLADWWARMSMWIDTYTELNLLGHGRRSALVLGHRYLAYTRHADGVVRPVNWTIKATISLPELIEVPSSDILARCFHLAGTGAMLPPEWQYLRDARSWLETRQTRRAVIDGCTAAEIALANQVHKLLADTGASVRDELLLRCNGISDVAKLVRRFGGSTASRNKIEEKLAQVRNRAAHAGEEPPLDQASEAIEIANEVVNCARPLENLHEQT
ncbi:hypothetical protein [Nocardia sp. N2S4-5]|uniref:hypothetical protein n=1 Tax=Nocardia sp. N2S4-5 TaxID=3351565 RepID=UPI0037D08CC3